jgi:OmcA/MtrC family decaheme c-type cytochrome
MDPRPFDTLRFTLGGPTTDYSSYVSENAQATTTFDGTTATYTFQSVVPATAKGTWMLTCDVELTVPLKQGDGKPDNTNFTESPINPVFYIAITDPTPVPRRTIVDIAKCNVCHDRLGAHGGQRLVTQGCVICHNPVNDDSSQRPASAGMPESIDLRRMIHRIHTGDELTQDFTIFGHGGRAVNFNSVAFPGDRRDCAICHTSITTAEVPTGATLNVITQRDFFSPQGPATAACTGCHDTRDVAAHALINTAYFPNSKTIPAEACATCHTTGATYAVDVVHAR